MAKCFTYVMITLLKDTLAGYLNDFLHTQAGNKRVLIARTTKKSADHLEASRSLIHAFPMACTEFNDSGCTDPAKKLVATPTPAATLLFRKVSH